MVCNGHPYIRPMHKISIVAGDRLVLKCPVTGYPITSIMWEKEGTVLPVDFRQEAFPNGTLVVQNVQRTADTGKYTCSVNAPENRMTRRDVEVSVMVAPKIVPFSFPDAVLREGTRARLQCVVSEGDVPLTISWTKDGALIPRDLGVAIRDLDEFSSILTIESVSPHQNGRYTCTVSNEAASVNHSAILQVNVPPRWVLQPQDVDVLVGKSVRLDCQADGFPKPIITWMKVVGSGTRQSIQNSVHYQIFNNGTLRLLSADENDRGHYFCLANNGIGVGLSKMVHLNVRVPVKFDVKYRHQTIKRGSDAALICQVRGDPPVQLSWQLNERAIDFDTEPRYAIKETPSNNGLVSELRILRVERQDTATFSCLAKNDYGRDDSSIKLLILEIPDAPKMVKVIDHKSRVVRLSWTQPYDGNSPIIKYLVQYKPLSASWIEGATNVSVLGLESATSVSSLLPAHDYHFRVFAENEVGRSEPSEMVQVTTEEEAPSGPPLDVRVQATSSESLLVTWKSPKKSLWNGELLGYSVGYRVYDSNDHFTFRTVDLTGDPQRDMAVELNSLRKYTKYGVVIRAFNRIGSGSNSDEVIEQTREDVPTLPPENVECVALSAQSLQVAWQPPQSYAVHGQLQGYKVVYKPSEEWYDGVEPETKITTALKTIIHGLARYSNYSIQVLSFTTAGDGELSSAVYCNTMEDVPEAPADIKALVMSVGSILIVWKSPVNRNGIITKYSVYMRSVDSGKEDTTKQMVTGDHTSYEFTGLQESRRYEFWVTASTSVGEGQSTHVVSVTLAGPPVPPRVAAFDEQLVTALGSDVRLSCRATGIPLPDREWKTRGQTVEKNDRFEWRPDGTLFIRDVQSHDIGNYTCHVWNSHGTDDVTYVVLVQVPPAPPTLSIKEVSTETITLIWLPSKTGGLPVLGYTVHYKREYGEWEEISLGSDHLAYTLFRLECGTRYQVYVTARNRIGVGDASQILTAKTEGAAPTVPPKERLIEESATYVTLHLDSWTDPSACPILYFVVHHKPRETSSWMLVSNNVQPQQGQFVIPDLTPASRYSLRMAAHNSAGSSLAEYDFATLTMTGVTLASEPAVNDAPEGVGASWDVRLVVAAGSTVVITALLIALACFFRRRQRDRSSQKEPVRADQYEKAATDPTCKSYTTNNSTSGSFTYLLNNHERPRSHIMAEFDRKETQRNEDNSAEELRTFSQRRTSEIEDMYSKVRKTTPLQRSRPTHFKYADSQAYASPDHESCEDLGMTHINEPSLQLHSRHECTPGVCDHRVPDLLEHGPESGSSNEPSPILDKSTPFLCDVGRGRGLMTPMRQHRPNSRYYDGQAVKPDGVTFQENMDVYLPYYDGSHQFVTDNSCGRERAYRPT